MERVIILRGLDDFEAFRAALSKDWQEFQVYALRPSICVELRTAGIPAHTLSEHITAEEAERIYQDAFADATRIVEAVSSAQGAGIIQLARLFKPYYWEFLVDVYALDAVLSKWTAHTGDISLHYVRRPVPSPTQHAKLVDPIPLTEHVFNALRLRGQVKPIPVPTPLRADNLRRLRGWMAQIQNNASRTIWSAIRHKSAKGLEFPAGRWAIGWGNSYDALTVAPDMLQVAEETRLEPLLVTEQIDSSTNRTGLTYQKSYDSIERFSLAHYLANQPSLSLTPEESEQAERAYTGLLAAIDTTEVGARYQLSSLLRSLRPEFTASLMLAKQMDHILSQWAGSTLALTHFNGLYERVIEQLAPRHNIQVYAKLHGWIANPEGFEFEAAQYVVPGRLQAQFVRQFFGYGERVVAKPDLNLTRVADEWLSKSDEERQTIATQKKHSLNIAVRYVVVILATMARNRILNEFDYPMFENCWLSILDYLKSHPELHIVVKSHPTFNYNPWLSALAMQQKVKNISVLAGRLEEVLGWADLVVDLGYPGTAVIVALLFGKPLLLYRGLYKYVRYFGDIAHATGKEFTVDTPFALLEEFDKLMREGEAYLQVLKTRNQVLREGLAGDTK